MYTGTELERGRGASPTRGRQPIRGRCQSRHNNNAVAVRLVGVRLPRRRVDSRCVCASTSQGRADGKSKAPECERGQQMVGRRSPFIVNASSRPSAMSKYVDCDRLASNSYLYAASTRHPLPISAKMLVMVAQRCAFTSAMKYKSRVISKATIVESAARRTSTHPSSRF
jgi:hypothetical protein